MTPVLVNTIKNNGNNVTISTSFIDKVIARNYYESMCIIYNTGVRWYTEIVFVDDALLVAPNEHSILITPSPNVDTWFWEG